MFIFTTFSRRHDEFRRFTTTTLDVTFTLGNPSHRANRLCTVPEGSGATRLLLLTTGTRRRFSCRCFRRGRRARCPRSRRRTRTAARRRRRTRADGRRFRTFRIRKNTTVRFRLFSPRSRTRRDGSRIPSARPVGRSVGREPCEIETRPPTRRARLAHRSDGRLRRPGTFTTSPMTCRRCGKPTRPDDETRGGSPAVSGARTNRPARSVSKTVRSSNDGDLSGTVRTRRSETARSSSSEPNTAD